MNHEQAVSTLASERYLLDEMSEPERSGFEEHYFSCTACAADVRMGALMREGVQSGAKVLRPRRFWYRSAALPWAAAATLAIITGYESFVLLPGLRRETGPQALTPVTLRPATRGEAPIVPVGPATSLVTLAIDLTSVNAGAELAYDVRTAAGTSVVTGRAEAPSSGAPLLLLIPARIVSVPGAYVVSVRQVASGDLSAEEYRFDVAAR